MDTVKHKTLRISRDCDEITAHNFFKLRDTRDLQWLYPKYDGWEDISEKLPENAQECADNIMDEYSKLIKNNTTLQYMDCIEDLESAATRIYCVSALLENIRLRWLFMKEDVRKEYIAVLKGWNFLFNPEKPLKDELGRLHRQLRAAKTKMKKLEADRKLLESNLKKGGVDIVKFKVMVQNILKRDIDLKKISIKEWHYTIESLPRKKAA